MKNSSYPILVGFAFASILVMTPAYPQSQNITVPGKGNPWLANGTTASSGSDTLPDEAPAMVSLQDIAAGDELVFTVTGSVHYGGGTPTDSPDGDTGGFRSLFHLGDSTNGGPENGIGGLNAPANSLVGVFLGSGAPTAPATFLNFAPGGNASIDYESLAPEIAQPFFIGDGRNASSVQQRVKIPSGATRLFLGSMDGSGWFNNSGTFSVQMQVAGEVAPVAPEHGGLSATVFRVNGQSAASNNVADTALHFSAQQTATPEGLKVRVQFSTTSDNAAIDWVDLANGSFGYMTLDKTTAQFVLVSTNYPLANGIYFRAISTAPGYAESKSNVIGPFNLTKTQNHLGGTILNLATNGPGAEIKFRSTVQTDQATLTLYVQSTLTPNNDASWIGLDDGRAGQMYTYADRVHFFLDTSKYPAGAQVYFRAVGKAVGFIDSYSNIIGVKDVVVGAPPTVEITPLTSPVSGNDGTTAASPLVYNFGTIRFNARLDPTQNFPRQIKKISLLADGAVIDTRDAGATSITTDYITNGAGDHIIKAIAVDELGIRGFAVPVYIRVKPSGGKIFTMTNSGDWSSESNWVDERGESGIPGAQDLAVIVGKNASLSNNVTATAISLTGGTLNGAGGALNVGGIFSIASGALKNINLAITSRGSMVLTGDENVPMSGSVTNQGTIRVTGRGGIVPVSAANFGRNGAVTDGFFDGVAAFFKNVGDFIFHRPNVKPAPAPSPQAAPPPVPPPHGVEAAKFENSGRLLSENGLGVVGNSGGTIIGNDGASLIGNDGASVISRDGAGLIGNDGASLITNDGGSSIAFNSAVTDAPVATEGFIQTGGETDLSGIQLVTSVALNGGTLSGSGVIVGSLTNNSGYISPGHSGGQIAVTGAFTQGAGGTLIIENGGKGFGQTDQLQVEGNASLGGSLHVRTINGYVPDAADTFSPLGFGSVSGVFSSISSNAQETINAGGLLLTTNPALANPPAGQPLNISTRMEVLGGNNVLIGGFIVTGSSGSNKKVLIRGIGPSLANYGISGVLADPLLEFHRPDGSVVTNDNWTDAPNKDQIPNGFAPSNPKESVIIADLTPGSYTVIEKGTHGETGIGLTEIYDLDGGAAVALANISTRGFIDTGDNVMIGGFIVGGTEPAQILVRATGPSLKNFGLTGVLEDPILELHDANGNVLTNDGWRETQEQEIIATTVQPSDNKEPAILANLVPGAYTAIVRGKDNTTGIAIVEAYKIK